MSKKLLIGTLIASLALGIFGCKKEKDLETKVKETAPVVRTSKGINYEFEGARLIQKTEDEDKTARFGVIADPHGYYGIIEGFSEHFKKEGVDGIIMLGDYAQHFRRKPHPRLSGYDEIYKCIEAAAKTGLPIYVIPGNHEMREDYKKAMEKLSKKYSNIFDLSKIRMVDGDDFDLVSNPFGNDNGFSYGPKSFLKGNAEIMRHIFNYAQQLKGDDDPEILISHQPPKGSGKDDIDVIFNGRNVGNAFIDKAIKEGGIRFSLSGHIHEAGGRGCASEGEPVEANVFSDDLRFNPGAASPWRYLDGKVYKGRAGIFTVKGNQAKYQVFSME